MCRYNKALSLSISRPAEGTRNLTRIVAIAFAILGAAFIVSPCVQASPLDFEDSTPQEILLAQRSIADSTAQMQAARLPGQTGQWLPSVSPQDDDNLS